MSLKLQISVEQGAEWVTWCKKRLSELTSLRQNMGTAVLCKFYEVPNNIMIQIVSSDIGDTIKIWGGTSEGFICRPRNPLTQIGWKSVGNGVEEVRIPGYSYPLSEEDGTSRAMLLDDNNQYQQNFQPQLYGNIDWIGINTANANELSNAPVLTWKGPPGRTLSFDPRVPIDGLTTSDISLNLEDFFTCFGPNIYSSGLILNTLPTVGDIEPKVLGCAFQGNTLVAFVNNHYTDKGFFDEIWFATSSTNTKLYDEKDNPGGWQKIDVRLSGRPTACWFFNQSGTKVTQGINEYVIDLVNKAITLITYPVTTGSMTVSADPTSYHILHEGSWVIWSDYKGDNRVSAMIRISGGDDTISHTLSTSQSAAIPLYYPGTQTFVPIVVSGDEAAAVGNTYTYTGGVTVGCPQTATWTMSGGTIDQGGVIQSISGCGMGSITVTLEPSGLFGTMAVRLPSGVWTSDGPTTYATGVGGACGPGMTVCLETGSSCGTNCKTYYITTASVQISGSHRITTLWGCSEVDFYGGTYIPPTGAIAPNNLGSGTCAVYGNNQPQPYSTGSESWVCP